MSESLLLAVGKWRVVRLTATGWKGWVSGAIFVALGLAFQIILARRLDIESPWYSIIGLGSAAMLVAIAGRIVWGRPIFAVPLRQCSEPAQDDDSPKPMGPPKS